MNTHMSIDICQDCTVYCIRCFLIVDKKLLLTVNSILMTVLLVLSEKKNPDFFIIVLMHGKSNFIISSWKWVLFQTPDNDEKESVKKAAPVKVSTFFFSHFKEIRLYTYQPYSHG